jgi:hypothetical protein
LCLTVLEVSVHDQLAHWFWTCGKTTHHNDSMGENCSSSPGSDKEKEKASGVPVCPLIACPWNLWPPTRPYFLKVPPPPKNQAGDWVFIPWAVGRHSRSELYHHLTVTNAMCEKWNLIMVLVSFPSCDLSTMLLLFKLRTL